MNRRSFLRSAVAGLLSTQVPAGLLGGARVVTFDTGPGPDWFYRQYRAAKLALGIDHGQGSTASYVVLELRPNGTYACHPWPPR